MEKLNRAEIKMYFYGNLLPMIVGCAVAVFGVLLLGKGNFGLAFTFIFLGCMGGHLWRVYQLSSTNASLEQKYDDCIQEDIQKFKTTALEKLGLLEEHVQIADPIVVCGPFLDYKTPAYLEGKTKFNKFITRLILKEGADKKIRSSLVQVATFHFSEDQIFIYQVNYDVCSGEVFEDTTYEYFYTDIDCVKTGERLEKTKNRGKIITKIYEYFSVVVTSGTSTYAVSDNEESILDHQVMSMRQLIREKKNQPI